MSKNVARRKVYQVIINCIQFTCYICTYVFAPLPEPAAGILFIIIFTIRQYLAAGFICTSS